MEHMGAIFPDGISGGVAGNFIQIIWISPVGFHSRKKIEYPRLPNANPEEVCLED